MLSMKLGKTAVNRNYCQFCYKEVISIYEILLDGKMVDIDEYLFCGARSSSGIYEIFNTNNGKRYIGQSTNIKQRFNKHRTGLRRKRHENKHLQSSWLKYGENAFSFEVLEYCDESELNEKERYYINLLKTNNNKNGYNIRIDAFSNRGLKWSDEQRKKMMDAIERNPYYHNHTIPKWIMEKGHEAVRNRIWTDQERLEQSKRLTGLKVQDTSKMKLAQQGENNPSAILCKDEVKEIKCLLKYTCYMAKDIANVYNVSRSNVTAIKSKRSWNSLNVEDDDIDYYLNNGIKRMVSNGYVLGIVIE